MKIKNLFITLGLALAAVGVAAGVGAANSDAKEAKAVGEGSFYVQLNSYWKNDDCSIGFYFFDDSNPVNSAWYTASTLDPVDDDQYYYNFSYEGLSFDPTKVIAVRIDRGNTPGAWCWNDGDTGLWHRTNNITLDDAIWLGEPYNPGDKYTKSGSFSLETTIKGGASDDWSVATVDVELTGTKISTGRDPNGHLEVYGSVTLPAGTYFKALASADVKPEEEGSGWYGNYTTGTASVASNLSGGGEANIHNTSGATYEMYFDFDDKVLHITDPVLADADEWAQKFLGTGESACSSTTKASWGTWASDYTALAGTHGSAFTSLFTGEEHVDHEADTTGFTFIQLAVQRYDYVLQRYGINNANTDALGYADFMSRSSKIPSGSGSVQIASGENNTNNTTLIIVLASVITLAAVGGYFLLRKRED